MRDPMNMNTIDYTGNPHTVIRIPNLPEYDKDDYDLFDSKDFNKYISDIENMVRNSFEYRQYIQYIRTNLDMNKCSFYSNVNNIDTTKIKIHVHHDPFTLADIVLIVFNKRSAYHQDLNPEMVAKEVMYLHYKLLVGLIPVAETVHELIHNQYLFVPTDKVMGHYRDFANQYAEFILPEQADILCRIEEATLACKEEYKEVLAKNYIYLDTTGIYNLPSMQYVADMMMQRVNDIKNGVGVPEPITPAYFNNRNKTY